MKNSILLLLLFATSSVYAQYTLKEPVTLANNVKLATGPEFTWDKKEHGFGEIPKGKPVTAEYKFKNTGNAPIILSDVKSTCGCTVPAWPKEPIMPGEEATIKATYNAKNPGAFTKRITVVSNTQDNYIYLLLKGKVMAEESPID